MRRYYYLFLLFCVWNGTSVYAQLSITATGVNYTQDFNSMGQGTGSIPGGFRAGGNSPSSFSNDHALNGTVTTHATNAGATAGGCYNWGYASNTGDRALGFLNSGSFSRGKSITLHIVNNTGVTINTIELDWNYEKYRSGSRAWDWTFFHGPASLATISAAAGNQSYATDGTNGTSYNPPQSVSKSVTLSGLSVAPGASYYFRWTLSSDGDSNGQGLAIDDFVINCSSNQPACPPGTPAIALGNDTAICAGTPFSLLLDAGNAGASFSWNNGAATSQTFTATQPGMYIVQVTDGVGCINKDTLQITSLALPVIPLSSTADYCAGTPFSMTLDAGNPGATYNWENGAANTQTYTVSTAGTYSVIVTGTNGCIASDSIIITQRPLPVINLGQDTSFCAGSPFFRIYNAGNPGSAYSWNGGTFTGQSFIANQADTYTVTVTTPFSCTASDTVIVVENPLPLIQLGQDSAYCAGAAFAWVLDAGNAGAAFNWNNGAAATQTFTALAAGTYSVQVTDANGCVNSDSVTVTEHPLPVVQLPADTAYCAGTPFGWTLDAGAFAGASYSWNNGAGTAQTFSVSTAGTYNLTVTDSNACVGSDSVIVTENALPVINLGNDTAYCAGNVFAWAINAGNAGASYNWNNGAGSAAVFTATTAGTYTVVVTDANGCVNTDSVIVSENPLPTLELGADVISSSQTAVLDAPAGFAAYNWSSGQNTASITVTQNGTYTLTVTDANGCSATDAVNVYITFSAEEAALTLDATVYPNPSDGYLHIRLNEALNGTADVALFNMAGQSVYNRSIQEAEVTLNLEHLPEGMYILYLNGDAKTRTFKIIIRK